jgi:hypothetical protein
MNLFDVLFAKKLAGGGDYPAIIKRVTGNPVEFTDGANAPLIECKSKIEGSQDLHGYDKPWVGGAGKNKLPLVLADIKSANTSGTWSGNAYTYNGCTFTILVDDSNNVTGIKVTGTASADIIFVLYSNVQNVIAPGTSVTMNGCPANGSSSTYRMYAYAIGYDYGSGVTNNIPSTQCTCGISVFSGFVLPTDGLVFYPMIRLATESDATFAPYSNICPITAYNQSTISVGGDMGYDTSDFIPHSAGVTKTVESDGILFSANGSVTYQDIAIGANNSLIVPPGTYTIEVDIVSVSDTNAESMFGLRKSNYSFIVPNIDSSSVGHKSLTVTTEESTYISMTLNGSLSSQNAIKIKNFKLINVEQQSTATFSNSIYQGNADFVGGSVMSDYIFGDFANVDWTPSTPENHIFRGVLTSVVNASIELSTLTSLCNKYGAMAWADISASDNGKYSYAVPANRIVIIDHRFSTVSDFVSSLSDIQMVFKLVAPTTETITPTNLPIKSLSGYNHIESSTGDLDITYITEGYQDFVDEIESTYGRRKGGKKPIDVFRMLEGNSEPKEEEGEKEEQKEEIKK